MEDWIIHRWRCWRNMRLAVPLF